jgi:WXG100 family type VII secretion target
MDRGLSGRLTEPEWGTEHRAGTNSGGSMAPPEGIDMAAEMKAGSGTLSRAAGMVSAAKADFDRLARNLSDQLQGCQLTWQGQGGAAFFQLHREWTDRQQRIVSALEEFEASLRSTERDNLATDAAQSRSMGNLTGRLGGVAYPA